MSMNEWLCKWFDIQKRNRVTILDIILTLFFISLIAGFIILASIFVGGTTGTLYYSFIQPDKYVCLSIMEGTCTINDFLSMVLLGLVIDSIILVLMFVSYLILNIEVAKR